MFVSLIYDYFTTFNEVIIWKQPQQGDKVEMWEFEWWMVVSSVAFFYCFISKSRVFVPHSISEQQFGIIVQLHFRKPSVPKMQFGKSLKAGCICGVTGTFYSSFLTMAPERWKISWPRQQEQSCFLSVGKVSSIPASWSRSCSLITVPVSTKACRLVNNVVSLISECSTVNDFNLFSVFCYVDPPLSHSDPDTRW